MFHLFELFAGTADLPFILFGQHSGAATSPPSTILHMRLFHYCRSSAENRVEMSAALLDDRWLRDVSCVLSPATQFTLAPAVPTMTLEYFPHTTASRSTRGSNVSHTRALPHPQSPAHRRARAASALLALAHTRAPALTRPAGNKVLHVCVLSAIERLRAESAQSSVHRLLTPTAYIHFRSPPSIKNESHTHSLGRAAPSDSSLATELIEIKDVPAHVYWLWAIHY